MPIKKKKSQVGPNNQRLQKVLAAAGVASRRNCEELILEGSVRVNRRVIDELPAFVDPENDVITVNGKRISKPEMEYYLLNKPKSVICTSSDPYGRKTAVGMIDTECRIFCVGRLDADTTGLIILTNDSELANRLTHPKYELPKVYEVRVEGSIGTEAIDKLKKGVWLAEGKTGRSAVKVIRRTHQESVVQITIKRGLNRQVRRTFAKVGYKVKTLKRTQIGNITGKGIKVGSYKKLSISQVKYLKAATKKQKPKTGAMAADKKNKKQND